jgi:hypothetical protein
VYEDSRLGKGTTLLRTPVGAGKLVPAPDAGLRSMSPAPSGIIRAWPRYPVPTSSTSPISPASV